MPFAEFRYSFKDLPDDDSTYYDIYWSTQITFLRHTVSQDGSIERRVRDMTSGSQKSVPSIVQSLYKRACKTVRQCLDKEMCTNFHDYFSINEHNRNTRNMAALINIPKVKLEFATQSFYFYGAKIYNDLPIEIRQEQHYRKFLSLLNEHFK